MNIPRRVLRAAGVDPAAWTRVARNPYGTMYRPAADRHLIPIGLDDDADAYVAAFERLNNLTPTKSQPQGASAGRRLEAVV